MRQRKKNMKKLFKLLCAVISVCMLVTVCACEDVSGNREYTFVMPDGAPALSVVKLMNDYPEIGGVKMNYKIVSADNIAAEFNSADIAIMPTNASAKLYNKGIGLKLAALNVFGNLYMVATKQISALEDLKGEVVYNIGEGKTTDLLLKYLLTAKGIEYEVSDVKVAGKVALHYEGDAQSVVAALMKGQTYFGVLGQPVVANAITKLTAAGKIAYAALDFQAAWKLAANDEYSFPQAGAVVKNAVAEDKAFMTALYAALEENQEFILNNSEQIAGILGKNGSSLTASFTREIVEACNIGCEKAVDLKTSLESYFTKIVTFDNTFVGGKLPDDGYYYSFS